MTDEQRQLVIDFKKTFASDFDCGIRVLEYISKFCMENRSTYVEGSARKSDFNEGARSVILEIRRKLNVNLDEKKQDIIEKEIL